MNDKIMNAREKNKELSEEFFDLNVRAERIIHIATQYVDEFLPSQVEEAFESDRDEIWEELGLENPSDNLEENLSRVEKSGKRGFLVEMAMPVISEDKTLLGWGYYTSRWFYADTLDDVYSRIGMAYSIPQG